MAMLVSYWERRDNADRERFGRAALDYCRAVRGQGGVRSARFYWLNPETLVLALDVESLEIGDRLRTPEVAQAGFALADLARPTRMERWGDAGRGEELYRMSQQAAARV